MLVEIPLEKVLGYLTPGGRAEAIPSNIFGTARSFTDPEDIDRAAKDKRIFKKTFIDRDRVHDSTFADLLESVGRARGVSDTDIEVDIIRIEQFLGGFEEGSYPLGIFGFISSELLPRLDGGAWLAPSMDYDIDLTLSIRKAAQSDSLLIGLLGQSDAAGTRTGQELLDLFRVSNDPETRVAAMAGLSYLTLYKFLTSFIAGPDLPEEALESCAGLLTRPADETCVARWFKSLRTDLGLKEWKSLDSRLRSALGIERNHDIDGHSDRFDTPGSRVASYRSGRKPLRFDQCERLLYSLRQSDDLVLGLEDAKVVWYRMAYSLAVLSDNMYQDWWPTENLQRLLPEPDFGDAFAIMHKRMRERWEAA
jgi:hypothetical protein